MKIKKMLLLLIAVFLMAALGACARADTAGESADTSTTVSTEQTDAAADEQPSDSGTLGDYTVSILDYDLIKDYKGNDAIRVYFEFTNNGEDAASFMFAIHTQAFQNGVELETGIVTDDVDEDDNSLKDIKTGATITCTDIFVLSDNSPVEVEASELISFSDDVLTKTFDIAE